jgi:phosphatidate cytidylyltransferase
MTDTVPPPTVVDPDEAPGHTPPPLEDADGRPPRTPITPPRLATVPNLVLVVALVAPAVRLAQRDDTAALVTSGIVAALLLFFTVLTRRLMRKGMGAAPELYGRTMTFWWMLAAFLVAQTTPRPVGFIIFGGLCLLAVYEFATMRPDPPGPGDRAATAIALATAPAATILAWYGRNDWTLAFFAIAIVVVAALPMALSWVVVDRTAGVAATLGWLVAGTVLCVGLLGHGLLILDLHDGLSLLIWCFLLTELRDLLSYWVGKFFAARERRAPSSGAWRAMNRKIAPTVSPNKAWGAGLVSILIVVAIGIAARSLVPDIGGDEVALWWVIATAAAIGFLGLFGDLVFSMLKRDAGVKDSGSLLPGGTGVLDRIDSLVLTIPATFQLAYWVYVYHG